MEFILLISSLIIGIHIYRILFNKKKIETLINSKEELTETKINYDIDRIISEAAFKWNVGEKLMRAIAKVESNFDYTAINFKDKTSYGLFQIHYKLAEGYGYISPYATEYERQKILLNPEVSADIAGRFLSDLFKKYKDINSVIQAYNLGETKFNKGYRSPDYLNKVLYYYNQGV